MKDFILAMMITAVVWTLVIALGGLIVGSGIYLVAGFVEPMPFLAAYLIGVLVMTVVVLSAQ